MPNLTPKQIRYNTQLLTQAIKNNDVEEFERLLPVSDPPSDGNECLMMAAMVGNTYILKRLIDSLDLQYEDNSALRWAADNGHIEGVKLLLPVSDPKALNSEALLSAAWYERKEIIQLLTPVSNYQDVLVRLLKDGKNTQFLQQCIDEHEAPLQKDRLNNALAKTVDIKQNTTKRKM